MKKSEFNPNAHWMTNIKADYKEALLKAANDLALNIWWEKNATDSEGYPLDNSVAVYTTETKDLTEFWDEYRKNREG